MEGSKGELVLFVADLITSVTQDLVKNIVIKLKKSNYVILGIQGFREETC